VVGKDPYLKYYLMIILKSYEKEKGQTTGKMANYLKI
jgi:hypothetical protein